MKYYATKLNVVYELGSDEDLARHYKSKGFNIVVEDDTKPAEVVTPVVVAEETTVEKPKRKKKVVEAEQVNVD